ncbi:ParA family protein (plasmid) [Rhodococcus pseudokoreensis]|uniref:ParA family protein n=1 Tax=Rhodococcus pseudokoreensis TaxID=2811421 RepID=A0A974ZRV2_9NOCA|nr:ParA family protein [Rhodococcus pseudokoreensis]QSE88060.1 ParA family protein [Rhodococcus pseudokoreensis]
MTITAIANLKGGVGKTVVANGLSHAAAAIRRPVLLVDADMQGNSTKHLTGYTTSEPAPNSLADVLDRSTDLPIHDAIFAARREEIHVVPSGFAELQAVSDQLGTKPGGEMSFARALKPVAGDYEHVLIDCRPAIDLVSRSALYAADNLLIVVNPEPDAVDGLNSIQNALEDLAEYMDKVLPIAGIVINKLDGRRNDHADVVSYLKEYAAADGIALLGDPIIQKADISKLTNVGMGFDEHPSNPVWSRNLHNNFIEILEKVAL